MSRAFLLALLWLLALGAVRAEEPDALLHVICYHDVVDDLAAAQARKADATTISTASLIAQFNWLRDNGYTVVSLQQVLDSRREGRALPQRPVLLTFDDGLRSLHARVYPLLRLYGYPALAGVVTSWTGRPGFATWDELASMQASGAIEIALHGHELHRGLPVNGLGAEAAAAVTRAWDPLSGAIEDEAAYRKRIVGDLAQGRRLLEQHLGRAPRALVWPYGAYNETGLEAARAAGIEAAFNLEPGANSARTPLLRLRRTEVRWNDELADFARALRLPEKPPAAHGMPLRAMPVDLAAIPDAASLDALLERIAALSPSAIFVRGYAPERRALFTRLAGTAWRRLGVQVHAVVPIGMTAAVVQELERAPELQGIVVSGIRSFDAPTRAALDRALAGMRAQHPTGIVTAVLPLGTDALTLRSALLEFDYVMLPSSGEGMPDALDFARRMGNEGGRLQHVIFELEDVRGESLVQEMHALQRLGVRHFAYAADDPARDVPRLARLREAFSVQSQLAPEKGP